MTDPIRKYWKFRLEEARQALEDNDFEAHVVESAEAARKLVLKDILPRLKPSSLSFGGSKSLADTGLYDAVKELKGVKVLDTWDKALSEDEKYELRREALLVDCFLTGTNAVTGDGMLVNLDRIGNRVAAITFGPRHAIVLAGRNKLVEDLQAAFSRIKEYAAPVNAMRLEKKTPCVKTGRCHDCKSEGRICNLWSIAEKSFPKGRIIVVLINEDMGF